MLPKYKGLQNLAPKYYGYGLTEDIKNLFNLKEYTDILHKEYKYYIVLENVTQYSLNILDLKLGKIHQNILSFSQGILSSKRMEKRMEKEEKELKNKNSLTVKENFRIDGVLLSSYGINYDKETCRNMSIHLVKATIDEFFVAKYGGKITRRRFKDWIINLILELKRINLNLYGPSILLCDQGFFLVDFACFEELNVENYPHFLHFHEDIIVGLQNLLKIL